MQEQRRPTPSCPRATHYWRYPSPLEDLREASLAAYDGGDDDSLGGRKAFQEQELEEGHRRSRRRSIPPLARQGVRRPRADHSHLAVNSDCSHCYSHCSELSCSPSFLFDPSSWPSPEVFASLPSASDPFCPSSHTA
jgi:hypothetical protein